MKTLLYFLLLFMCNSSYGQNCTPNTLIKFPDIKTDYEVNNFDSTSTYEGEEYTFSYVLSFDSSHLSDFVDAAISSAKTHYGDRTIIYEPGSSISFHCATPSDKICFVTNYDVTYKIIVGVNVNNINFTSPSNVTHSTKVDAINPDTLSYYTCDSISTNTFSDEDIESGSIVYMNHNTVHIDPVGAAMSFGPPQIILWLIWEGKKIEVYDEGGGDFHVLCDDKGKGCCWWPVYK